MEYQLKQKSKGAGSRQAAIDKNGSGSFFKPLIQPKLTVNAPDDIYEKEADAMADQVMRMPSVQPIQRKCAECEEEEKLQRKPIAKDISPLVQRKAGDAGAAVSPQVSDSLQAHKGSGKPLPYKTRTFMESRFGTDFSDVNVHTDAKAVQLSRDLNAQAFTHGSDIYFNQGKFAPRTNEGKHLLAHELTHVVQQQGTETISRQLSEEDCAKDCTAMDGTGEEKGKFKVVIYADKEGPFLLMPATHKVGHSWLKFVNSDGDYWTYGFWPKEGYDSSDIKADVDGCVHHPDVSHKPTSSQTFELTAEEFTAAKLKAVDLCNTKPKYNLFGLQCTSFVLQVLQAAGKAPNGGFGLIWESPNALHGWMKSNALLIGFSTTGTLPQSADKPTVSYGARASYVHQFYSLIGNKLRLQWLSTGELGSKVKTLSTGTSVEFNPQSVYIPSLYVFGQGTLGQLGGPSGKFGAGLKSGLGAMYNIDQIGFVQVEYSAVKDLVNKDPLLHQITANIGVRFF